MTDTKPSITGLRPGQHTTHWIGFSDLNPSDDPVKAAVFGLMVRLAKQTVEHYESDLFHDAKWIEVRMALPVTAYEPFVFAFRDTGTDVRESSNVEGVASILRMNTFAYELHLQRSKGTSDSAWQLHVLRIQ